MTILGGEFAVLLLFTGGNDDLDRRLSSACKRLEWERRLTVFFRPLEGPPMPYGHAERRDVYELVATGVDKAGIVARVCRLLAERDITIREMKTLSRPEPESGTPIYTMRVEMGVPASIEIASSRRISTASPKSSRSTSRCARKHPRISNLDSKFAWVASARRTVYATVRPRAARSECGAKARGGGAAGTGAQRARRGLRRRQDPREFRIEGAPREFRARLRTGPRRAASVDLRMQRADAQSSEPPINAIRKQLTAE